jgi:hypothetical protein
MCFEAARAGIFGDRSAAGDGSGETELVARATQALPSSPRAAVADGVIGAIVVERVPRFRTSLGGRPRQGRRQRLM